MLKFYRHCGEGWGWSGEKDYVRDNVPHGDPHSVLHEKTLEEIIEELIRADNKVTRAQMAEKIGVSVKTIARKLKEMKHIAFVGSGNNGHWEIKEQYEKLPIGQTKVTDSGEKLPIGQPKVTDSGEKLLIEHAKVTDSEEDIIIDMVSYTKILRLCTRCEVRVM